MNVRLKKTFEFQSGLIFDNRFMINHYKLDLSILTNTDDHHQQNVAYERMKYWIHEIMQDSILISDHSEILEPSTQINARVLAMPTEPVDQIVGIMLYLKLNAVMEDRMMITDVELCSSQGDFTSYQHNMRESIGTDLEKDGWWSDPRPVWQSIKLRDQGKVVSLDRPLEWKTHGLDWNESAEPDNDSVVFANFKKDETE